MNKRESICGLLALACSAVMFAAIAVGCLLMLASVTARDTMAWGAYAAILGCVPLAVLASATGLALGFYNCYRPRRTYPYLGIVAVALCSVPFCFVVAVVASEVIKGLVSRKR